MRHGINRLSSFAVLFAAVPLAIAAAAQGQATFIIKDLHPDITAATSFGSTYIASIATAIASTGEIVGQASKSNGVSVASSRAFVRLLDSAGNVLDVINISPKDGTVATRASDVVFDSIGNRLIVTGASFNVNPDAPQAFRWVITNDVVQGRQDLQVGANGQSSARAVNDAGLTVGTHLNGGRAFYWKNSGSFGSLPELVINQPAKASAVNTNGLVVGRVVANINGNRTVAALWTPDGFGDYPSAPTLLPLPVGAESALATGINDAGVITGYTSTSLNISAGAHNAVIWRPNVFIPGYHVVDISGAIDPAAGFTLVNEVRSIDEKGQMVGFATTTAGQTHAVLLQPDADSDLVPDFLEIKSGNRQ